jgi:tRNA (guanine-N7-)-methyltransferase
LAKLYPNMNFIGVDIKGARMWTGATQAINEGLKNVAFLRTNIEIIERFFAPGEVNEIWLTFSDPQMKKASKRLTSTYFLQRYRRFMQPDGLVHLKTDSRFLYTYTVEMLRANSIPTLACTDNLYGTSLEADTLLHDAAAIQTYYEQMWRQRGIDIKYLCFRLPQEGNLVESDVEIPLDDYRSYCRAKRSSKETGK